MTQITKRYGQPQKILIDRMGCPFVKTAFCDTKNVWLSKFCNTTELLLFPICFVCRSWWLLLLLSRMSSFCTRLSDSPKDGLNKQKSRKFQSHGVLKLTRADYAIVPPSGSAGRNKPKTKKGRIRHHFTVEDFILCNQEHGPGDTSW